MGWVYLLLAGLLECGWAVGLKYTEGFTKPIPSVLTVVAVAASFYMMSLAMRTIPLGTAYAVWVGIGAVGVAIFGMLALGESQAPLRILCLLLIVAGVLGLKLVS